MQKNKYKCLSIQSKSLSALPFTHISTSLACNKVMVPLPNSCLAYCRASENAKKYNFKKDALAPPYHTRIWNFCDREGDRNESTLSTQSRKRSLLAAFRLTCLPPLYPPFILLYITVHFRGNTGNHWRASFAPSTRVFQWVGDRKEPIRIYRGWTNLPSNDC
jgi:hypothetical protein